MVPLSGLVTWMMHGLATVLVVAPLGGKEVPLKFAYRELIKEAFIVDSRVVELHPERFTHVKGKMPGSTWVFLTGARGKERPSWVVVPKSK